MVGVHEVLNDQRYAVNRKPDVEGPPIVHAPSEEVAVFPIQSIVIEAGRHAREACDDELEVEPIGEDLEHSFAR